MRGGRVGLDQQFQQLAQRFLGMLQLGVAETDGAASDVGDEQAAGSILVICVTLGWRTHQFAGVPRTITLEPL